MSLDIRLKFLLLFDANLLLLLRIDGWILLQLLLLLFLAFCLQGRWKKGLIYLAIALLLWLADLYLLDYMIGNWSIFASMLFVGGRLMLPTFMAGSLLLSTSAPQELIAILRRMHLPEGLILTMAVMLRFLPVARQESRQIRQALRLRGVLSSWQSRLCHPLLYFEYCLIPLILSAGRLAQDLTIAILTKGVAAPNRKSIYPRFTFGPLDWIYLLCLLSQLFFLGAHP